jgi:hypothetical protein
VIGVLVFLTLLGFSARRGDRQIFLVAAAVVAVYMLYAFLTIP